jgi:hypothetical protein
MWSADGPAQRDSQQLLPVRQLRTDVGATYGFERDAYSVWWDNANEHLRIIVGWSVVLGKRCGCLQGYSRAGDVAHSGDGCRELGPSELQFVHHVCESGCINAITGRDERFRFNERACEHKRERLLPLICLQRRRDERIRIGWTYGDQPDDNTQHRAGFDPPNSDKHREFDNLFEWGWNLHDARRRINWGNGNTSTDRDNNLWRGEPCQHGSIGDISLVGGCRCAEWNSAVHWSAVYGYAGLFNQRRLQQRSSGQRFNQSS